MQPSRRDTEPSPPIPTLQTSSPIPHFTILVAGCCGGKSAFLRLLLETCRIAPNPPKTQLSNVLNFIETSAEPTTSIHHLTLDLLGDLDGSERLQRFQLTLIDTPSFQFSDSDPLSDNLVLEILSLIDSRLAGAMDEHHIHQAAQRFITLCIYFLDPENLVPSRGRPVGSDQPSIFLDHHNVQVIRQLAERVNVLPVICKADIMTNERLSAVKFAVRRDLADAGIGFGIFDRYRPTQPSTRPPDGTSKSIHYQNNGNPHRRSLSNISTPTVSGMPYTLISPDLFDGPSRVLPTRAELMDQYSPSTPTGTSPPPQRTFIRSYRWGHIDVLDPNHCDFTLLKFAVFRHLQTLHDYTKGYLFDKFKSASMRQQSGNLSRRTSLDSPTRPTLAINTAPPSHAVGRSSLPSKSTGGADSVGSNPSTSASAKSIPVSRAPKNYRSGKITVACQFCRSRKLKCDGGRPACSQCSKRSHPCDYSHTRRVAGRRRDGEDSDSDSMEIRSEENEESPSASRPSSRQNRTIFPALPKLREGFVPSLPPLRPPPDQFEEPPPPSSKASTSSSRYIDNNELPHIDTLSLPEPTAVAPLSAPLPPLRHSDQKHISSIRKRAATVQSKIESGRLSGRLVGVSGPKVVACNFCRARKTKCDGSHPCQQCSKRSLPCDYAHDSGSKRGGRRASSSTKTPAEALHSPPSSSRMLHAPTSPQHVSRAYREDGDAQGPDSEGPPPKRMRLSDAKPPSGPNLPHMEIL